MLEKCSRRKIIIIIVVYYKCYYHGEYINTNKLLFYLWVDLNFEQAICLEIAV